MIRSVIQHSGTLSAHPRQYRLLTTLMYDAITKLIKASSGNTFPVVVVVVVLVELEVHQSACCIEADYHFLISTWKTTRTQSDLILYALMTPSKT